MNSSRRSLFAMALFIAAISTVLFWAWSNRASGMLTPSRGTGYWLGISGAVMMLIVLLYPLRKRMRFIRNWGHISWWFRWHMIFGIVGPTLIVLHSNYSIHSMNALVAFVAMLIVVASGIVGRYLYARIHRGLYGAKVEARDLTQEAAALLKDIDSEIPVSPAVAQALGALERIAVQPSRGFFSAIARAARLSREARRVRQMLLSELKQAGPHVAATRNWSAAELRAHELHCRALARRYDGSLRRAGTLAIYERLFALWHVLHLPLIALLAATAVIHVIAVNLY